MLSEGHGVTRYLTSRATTNNTRYSASDKGRNLCRVFSETAAFGSYCGECRMELQNGIQTRKIIIQNCYFPVEYHHRE